MKDLKEINKSFEYMKTINKFSLFKKNTEKMVLNKKPLIYKIMKIIFIILIYLN